MKKIRIKARPPSFSHWKPSPKFVPNAGKCIKGERLFLISSRFHPQRSAISLSVYVYTCFPFSLSLFLSLSLSPPFLLRPAEVCCLQCSKTAKMGRRGNTGSRQGSSPFRRGEGGRAHSRRLFSRTFSSPNIRSGAYSKFMLLFLFFRPRPISFSPKRPPPRLSLSHGGMVGPPPVSYMCM